ncbi:MAG: N-acetyl-gamma-glutamyl-phosphate reductase [bacterium]
MVEQKPISIIGASGYSGAELLRFLLKHKGIHIEKIFAASSAGKRVDELYPWFSGATELVYEQYSPDAIKSSDLVFIALPSGEAMNIVPELLSRGKRVIDLGGDYRLKDDSLYTRYYKHEHTSKDLLQQAVYGLPEWNREKIKSAQLVANPGCYPTSAILPLAPLLKDGFIERNGITINSLSGTSGAGRSAGLDLSFAEVNETVKAYKVGNHQHIPEIISLLKEFSSGSVNLTFVPHLLPITRGIYTSISATLVNGSKQLDILSTYDKYYASDYFVRYSDSVIPEMKHVNYTNFINIGFRLYPESNQIIVLSAIDNLIKGAAGQAIQNMNIMFGFTETEGLL